MIHDIGVELQAALTAKGCPFVVVDGPEPTGTTSWGRERIVIEHDRDGGDGFAAPKSQHNNPHHRATRRIGVKLKIYAQEPNVGAGSYELSYLHVDRAEQVLDLAIVGLELAARTRQNSIEFKSGKLFTPPDLDASEVHNGAAYELKFGFDRAVTDRKWDGTARPTATIARRANTTTVDEETEETACGGT